VRGLYSFGCRGGDAVEEKGNEWGRFQSSMVFRDDNLEPSTEGPMIMTLRERYGGGKKGVIYLPTKLGRFKRRREQPVTRRTQQWIILPKVKGGGSTVKKVEFKFLKLKGACRNLSMHGRGK